MLPKLLLSFIFLSLLAVTLSNVIQQQETSDVQAVRLKRSCSSPGRINWVRFRLRLNCNEAQAQRDTVSLRATTRPQIHLYFNVNLRVINALLEAFRTT